MSIPLQNYLRTYRKRSGFTQTEVAFLLGSDDGMKVSRYENRVQKPTLETALAYEAIFRVPAKELFAGLYRKVEKQTMSRAQLLAQKLAGAKQNRTTPRKLAALRSLSVLVSTGTRRHS
jgi:transcriptional regulator with XRE-family HTH domain